MPEYLTQEQLNASTVIRAIVDLQMVNINPKYGFGLATSILVEHHIKSWDHHTKTEMIEKLTELIEMFKREK